MPCKVHGIVEKPQNFDGLAIFILPNAEHDEVPAFMAKPRDMQREQSWGNFSTRFGAEYIRPRSQRGQRGRNRVGVNLCLCFAKLFERPDEDGLDISLCRCRKADRPWRRC